MLKKLTPNLMVDDVNFTIDYYQNVLGFEFVMAVPENSQEILSAWQKDKRLDYAMLKISNVEIMFQSRSSLAAEISDFENVNIGGSITFYFEMEDVEGFYEKIKDKVIIINELFTKFYGMKEFYIKDCNGYILAFAEQV